ncbi:MAG: hypothetical protein SFW67_16625 [Myxococcaceae bacterium]|nr:hypothetical protein [Myxococcaceae bacterium]
MNCLCFIGVGLLAAVLARGSLPTLAVLPAWKTLLSGTSGALAAGAVGSLLAQENPLSLVTFGPVGLALATVGAAAVLLGLEAANPPDWR